MTLSMMAFSITINKMRHSTEHCYAECPLRMLSVICAESHISAFYVECHHAESPYTGCCCYAECRGALYSTDNFRTEHRLEENGA